MTFMCGKAALGFQAAWFALRLERFILSSMKRCLVVGDSQPFPYANNSSLGCLHRQNTYGGSSPIQNPNLLASDMA